MKNTSVCFIFLPVSTSFYLFVGVDDCCQKTSGIRCLVMNKLELNFRLPPTGTSKASSICPALQRHEMQTMLMHFQREKQKDTGHPCEAAETCPQPLLLPGTLCG